MNDSLSSLPEPPPESASKPQSPRDSVGWGLLLGLAILLGHGLLLLNPWNSEMVFLAILCPGATQWLIVIPLAVYWYRNGRRQSMKGLLIFAGVVSLLNAACFGLVITSLNSMH